MFRIKMAIAKLEEQGKTFDKKSTREALFPEANENTQIVNLNRIIRGAAMIRPEWVPILCEKLECSADFLFGIEKTKDDE